jgi:hypothetical protein
MADSDEIKKIKAQLEELKKEFDAVGKKNIDNLIKNLEKGSSTLEDWKFHLNAFQDQADKVSSTFDYVAKSFKDAVNELSQQNKYLTSSKNIISQLSKMAQETLSVRRGETSIDAKALKAARDKIALQERELRNNRDNISATTKEGRAKRAEIQSVIDELGNYKKGLEDVLETDKQINKELGIAPKLAAGVEKALSKLGLPNLGINDALDKTKKLGQAAARAGDKDFSAMATFTKEVGKNLKNALSTTNLFQGALTLLISALKTTDDETGKLAKGFNMTYSEALKTRRELGSMAAISGDVALNTKNLQETLMAVGQSLGSNAKLNDADLKTFTKLREQAGYTNEQLASIQKLSLVNGKTLEQNTKEILGGAKAYASRKGLVINEKQVLDDVAKASATLKLSLGGSADELARSAVQARAVGLNLAQAAAMAESLLNFETSIENELSAELLLGKDLNFERARTLALNNDIAGAAEEIANQVGTSADFAKMNAIQQDAIAKAAGLTKEQLAQSLIDREALTKLSGVEGKDAKEKFNNLVKQVGMEEAKKRLGNEQLATQFQQQSVQERFTQAVEKLKEVFVQIAEPILAIVSPLANLVSAVLPAFNILLQPIVFAAQLLADTFSYVSNLITSSTPALITFGAVLSGILITQQSIAFQKKQGFLYDTYSYAMKQKDLAISGLINAKEIIGNALSKKNLILGIAEAAMGAFKAMTAIPIVGPILGAAAAASAVALGYSLMKGDDILSPPPGGGGYGKRTLFGPEGAIALNDKDTIVATTNPIGKADDMMSAPKGALTVSNKTTPPPPPPDNNAVMLAEMKRGNDQREEQLKLQKRDSTVSTIRVQ